MPKRDDYDYDVGGRFSTKSFFEGEVTKQKKGVRQDKKRKPDYSQARQNKRGQLAD